MDIIQAIILGLVQGASEFVPISSSGHLVLVPWLLGWPQPGLVFDTVVHWGTLVAVLVYFWRDFIALASAWGRSLASRNLNEPEARIAWLIIVGTLPAALMGYVGEDFFESLFAAPAWVAGFLLVTGLILALGEWLGNRRKEPHQLTFLDSIIIGIAQGCAIAPGISRSGATMAAGLFRELKREAAARYSFLLATPIIFGAGLLQLLDLFDMENATAYLPSLVIGFLAAAISGYLCIRFLLSYLQRGKLYAFAIYCWLAGGICLVIAVLPH
ncbi:MAG: undecaprenyl-diphosphatase UppP [Anaerolineales bacterium]|nr:MAG: undecaprenyl-diphosphatase UppP [Anaerolineales bacterium]